MSKLSNAVLEQALQLSAAEKSQVIEALLMSLDQPDPEIDKVWATEAEARLAAFDDGHVDAVSAESVLGKYSKS